MPKRTATEAFAFDPNPLRESAERRRLHVVASTEDLVLVNVLTDAVWVPEADRWQAPDPYILAPPLMELTRGLRTFMTVGADRSEENVMEWVMRVVPIFLWARPSKEPAQPPDLMNPFEVDILRYAPEALTWTHDQLIVSVALGPRNDVR